jgi:hypothetical protein
VRPVDYRNETWEDVLKRAQGDRMLVYGALLRHGPCTTRKLADAMGWDLCSVRPRVTELCQLCFARVAGGEHGEGFYEAVNAFEAKHKFEEQKREVLSDQLLLKI